MPCWPSEPEPWVLTEVPLGAVYALTDPKQKTGLVNADMVWGPNMAVRSRVFEKGFRFDENIGPAAGQYTMGSEVEFTCRVAREGYQSWFLSEAVVGHMIRPNQMDRNWIVKRAYRFGKLKCLQQREKKGGDLVRVPRWRYGAVVRNLWYSTLNRLIQRQSARFKADWELQYQLGYIAAARQLNRTKS